MPYVLFAILLFGVLVIIHELGHYIFARIFGVTVYEFAIGMVNNKTTACRLIPAPGKKAGEWVEFGGLLGGCPVMPVSSFGCADFINRGGRIPAPIHSFRN